MFFSSPWRGDSISIAFVEAQLGDDEVSSRRKYERSF
jgi:hypothetical protein